MVLRVHSDVLYLSEYQDYSRSRGNFFLGVQNFNKNDNNEDILTISQIIKNVMVSASDAECADLFINDSEVVVVRTTL